MYEWKNKTDEAVAKIVTGNQKRFEDRRRDYEPMWELVTKVFRPRRHDLLINSTKGKRYGADVYDQSPANALSKFSSGKLGYMVNRSVPWIQFITPNARMMSSDNIKTYCQDAAEQILYAAGRSNFYSAVTPHTLDADSIGTSVMIPMKDERKDRIVFDVVHPKESYIGVNEFGDPIIYHRTLKLTRMTAVSLFGKDVLPSNWFKDGELKEILTEDDYVWGKYPNGDRDSSSLNEKDKPYMTLCVLMGSTGRNKSKLVYRRGSDYFVICSRTGRNSGEEYGTSIAADCLTSALVMNKLSEKSILQAHRVVDPPVIASRSIQSTFTMNQRNPGAVTWVDDIRRDGVQTWLDKQPWPITDAQWQRLDAQITDKMFIRFFEMLSAGDIKARTAYEVSQMMAEKATLMSTIIDTFEQETLEPVIEILIKEETEAGRMPDPPEELFDNGGKIDIRYLGPLAQLQRSLLRSKGTIDALQIIAQMMQMSQEVGWKFNFAEMAEDVAVAQGMPQKFIVSDEQFAQQKEAFAQQQQMMQTAAMAESAGKSAGGLSKAPEEGSPEEAMLAGMGA